MKFKKLFKLLIKDIIKSIEKGTIITIIVRPRFTSSIHLSEMDRSMCNKLIDKFSVHRMKYIGYVKLETRNRGIGSSNYVIM